MPTLYYQLVYTLMNMLPPPLDDTPAALRARDLTAIAKIAALAPVNADEADIAAHCIAATSQAKVHCRQSPVATTGHRATFGAQDSGSRLSSV